MGVGKHLLTLMELIAKRANIKQVSMPIQLNDDLTIAWLLRVGKGYVPDASLKDMIGFDADMEGFQVFHKVFQSPVKVALADSAVLSTPAKKGLISECSPTGVCDAPSSPSESLFSNEGKKIQVIPMPPLPPDTDLEGEENQDDIGGVSDAETEEEGMES